MRSRFPSLLKHAVLAFFRHDVGLRRHAGRVRLVLRERGTTPAARPAAAPTRADATARRLDQDLILAREELARLLDEPATLRARVRHLAFIEHALEKKGWRGLHKVPLEALQKALEQFEGLVTNWSPAGLACLRSKMAVAIIDREHQNGDPEADAYRTAAVLDSPPSMAADAINEAKASAAADEDAELLAAYAALGSIAPGAAVEIQGELGAPSSKALARGGARS